jgi:hypothetical protein
MFANTRGMQRLGKWAGYWLKDIVDFVLNVISDWWLSQVHFLLN